MKLGAKRGELEQLMEKFVPGSHVGIFHNNAPNPPHWTLNLCFGPFRSIWVHLGSFRNCMKLVVKHTELVQLMQKFVPRSCVVIFRNQFTWSTPLDPKVMFWCVSYYLGAFGTVWLLYETWCKTGRTTSKVRATKSRRNFSQWPHQIHPIGP